MTKPLWIEKVGTFLLKDSFLSFLGGVAATFLGFLLAVCWDNYKDHKNEVEKKKIVGRILSNELQENKRIISKNIENIEKELSVLGHGQIVVQPFASLNTGAWQIALIQMPDDSTILSALPKIRETSSISSRINEELNSRENFRIHNMAMNNLIPQLKMYDERILSELKVLNSEIDSAFTYFNVSK